MNIELRNIQIQDRQSDETTAFTASLYINNFRVGYAKNSGKGGCTDYGLDNYHDERLKELLKEAEDYCSGLEPMDLGDLGKVPMDLENFIDQMISDHWQEKENKRFKNALKKHCDYSLCIGNDKQYQQITWPKKNSKWKIAELLATETGRTAIKNTIEKYKANLKPGERILNQNIPEDLL